jgi:hyperosmotically inducible protein
MMVREKCLATAGLCLIGLLVGPVFAHQAATQSNTASDNTKVNQRDRKTSEPTADQGKNASSDREMMRKIRRAVVADKSLSTYAHNIKIISQGGKVTLKGPVHTEEEKKGIEAKAAEIAGAGNVTNDITVKGDAK